jgi:16S rRNA (uracil1498-N3)-methyltransferase
MDRYHLPDLPAEGQPLVLDESESGHAVRVMRLREGDGLELVDGRGWVVEAVVAEAHPKRMRCSETSRRFIQAGPEAGVTLAVGLIKNADRLAFLLEKATEIGVGRILLFDADRSERSTLREDRCRAHLLAAMKQSKRAWLPEFGLCRSTEDAILATDGSKRVVAHELSDRRVVSVATHHPLSLFIGPEGGFSDREIDLFKMCGSGLVGLGEVRLRTETAALVMLTHAIHLRRSAGSIFSME